MREFFFYLSYARRDLDPSLERFFHDLQAEVELLTGRSAVGFMDQHSIQLSDPWEATIADALGRSRVLVALYSPAYFQSEFCGKEWTVFLSRRRTSSGPTGIVPVLWSPWGMLRDVPEVAARINHSDPQFPDTYEEQGLRYMLRLRKHRDDYRQLIARLGQVLVEAAESAALPPLAKTPAVSQVRSTFGPEAVPDVDRKPGPREGQVDAKMLSAFLCHASGDKPRVRDLYTKLAASGIDPWLDEKKLLPGQHWSQEITSAVRKSDVVIVCFSRVSVTKAGFVQKEMRLALEVAEEQPDGRIFLIPVRLEECDVPDRFTHLHYANLFEDDGYTKLINALQIRASEVSARMPKDG